MSLTPNFVLKALLQYNYFPLQREDKDELPPVFSSVAFSPRVARRLVAGKQRKSGGWDCVECHLTRFNGVPRVISIPHPLAHAHLSLCIHDNWPNLAYTEKGPESQVRPRRHRDGRIIIMDYEEGTRKFSRQASQELGNRFCVHTDIANFFPSIYSHSVAWAAVGFSKAKASKNTKSAWFNQLDEKLRYCKRNETNGIPIGPASSNVIAESILCRVDEALRNKPFVFNRYVDDYRAYCREEKDAQEFIRLLQAELARFKLLLNIKKTKIEPLPVPLTGYWVANLSLLLPKGLKGKKGKRINEFEAAHFLSLALSLAKEEPDGSVVKYAVKSLLGQPSISRTDKFLADYLLSLSFYYPTVIPLLRKLFRRFTVSNLIHYEDHFNKLLMHHAVHRRSDAVCWLLHYMRKMGIAIKGGAFDAVLESRDCLSILSAFFGGTKSQEGEVVQFAKKQLSNDLCEMDTYWLLLYELSRLGRVIDPYSAVEDAFGILKGDGVSFINLRAKI